MIFPPIARMVSSNVADCCGLSRIVFSLMHAGYASCMCTACRQPFYSWASNVFTLSQACMVSAPMSASRSRYGLAWRPACSRHQS